MRESYTQYNLSSGKLDGTVFIPPATLAAQLLPVGQGWIVGQHDGSTSYVLSGEVVDRPTNPADLDLTQIPADGETPITLSGLPLDALEPVTVIYCGPDFTLTDSIGPSDNDCEFTADYPGQYSIRVQAFPYLDWEVSFEAI